MLHTMDNSAEDYNDGLQEVCPDGYQFDAGSESDSESNWMSESRIKACAWQGIGRPQDVFD